MEKINENEKIIVKKIFSYTEAELIGTGTYGAVYKGRNEVTQESVAIKRIDRKLVDIEALKKTGEIKILQTVNSEYMVRLIDWEETNTNLYLIMEYAKGNTLEIRVRNKLLLTEDQAITYLKQMARAFLDLKEAVKNSDPKYDNIMHRDIKPANIIELDGKIKIVDMGIAKIFKDDQESGHTINKGTPNYMSPQILGNKKYTDKTDIWSAGVMFYELLFGERPWNGNSVTELKDEIDNIALDMSKFSFENDFFHILLRKMLRTDEESRPTWDLIDKNKDI